MLKLPMTIYNTSCLQSFYHDFADNNFTLTFIQHKPGINRIFGLFSVCHPSVCPSSFADPISGKFHTWIISIKILPKFEYGFVRQTIITMADKMAAACQFALVDILIVPFLPNVIYELGLSNSHPSLNMGTVR